MNLLAACRTYRDKDSRRFDEASLAIIRAAKGPEGSFTKEQVVILAGALAESGDTVVLPDDLRPTVDVPSTGGPASLSTLLCPLLVASDGICVPQLSATGSIAGAVDTMALIPNFNVALGADEFAVALRKARIAHSMPHQGVCPADENLIAHRRSTGL
ncbi:unnamed protein product, partial [marine sediment metagenome]